MLILQQRLQIYSLPLLPDLSPLLSNLLLTPLPKPIPHQPHPFITPPTLILIPTSEPSILYPNPHTVRTSPQDPLRILLPELLLQLVEGFVFLPNGSPTRAVIQTAAALILSRQAQSAGRCGIPACYPILLVTPLGPLIPLSELVHTTKPHVFVGLLPVHSGLAGILLVALVGVRGLLEAWQRGLCAWGTRQTVGLLVRATRIGLSRQQRVALIGGFVGLKGVLAPLHMRMTPLLLL